MKACSLLSEYHEYDLMNDAEEMSDDDHDDAAEDELSDSKDVDLSELEMDYFGADHHYDDESMKANVLRGEAHNNDQSQYPEHCEV